MHMPVDDVLPRLADALQSTHRAILTAPPGSGKTTRVPPFLMERMEGTILMLEPRRIAARAAARFMAAGFGEKPGGRIGYRVRFDSRTGPDTRVEVITEGVLTRRLISDPELTGVSCVLFDEFHERSLQADTGLALCLEIQQALRPDLGIAVMSATLDEEELSAFLSPCPVIHAEGRPWPVEIRHSPVPAGAAPWERIPAVCRHAASTVRSVLASERGSILVFLPGRREMDLTAENLGSLPPDATLHMLHGDMPPGEQDAAIAPAPDGTRKVVLATSIAETSLTIEGIRVVIDSGLSRTARFSPATGMSALVTERVTQDAADQRAGRAGRLGPGVCIRLWHKGDPLLPSRRPEILEADLAPFLLDMLAWGASPSSMPFLTPPPAASLAAARDLLVMLRAAAERDGRLSITPHGRTMAGLPVHPRIASMLLRSGEKLQLASALAALAEERTRPEVHDIRALLSSIGRNGHLLRAAERIHALASGGREKFSLRDACRDEQAAGGLASLAWPDRIAQKKARGSFRLATGRGAALPETDVLAGEEFLAVAALDGGADGTAKIHLAAPLGRDELERLHGERAVVLDSVFWDSASESVSARRKRLLGALVLEDRPLAGRESGKAEILRAMLEGIVKMGPDSLPWTGELRQWQARVMLMRSIEGDPWPDVGDGALIENLAEKGAESWLAPWLEGTDSRARLQAVNLRAALSALLPFSLARRLEQEAPLAMTVPSGSEVRIDYRDEGGPSISVKLQEMFGRPSTPAVCSGRRPLLLRLLSPAGRPLQITRDLAGFWAGAYAAVRAEMRGRYPKHPWPEDPVSAIPTKKTKRALEAAAGRPRGR